MLKFSSRLHSYGKIIIMAILVVLNYQLLRRWLWSSFSGKRDANHSFVNFDFPPTLIPLEDHPYNSKLVMEDSIYYGVNASADWRSIFPFEGEGFVRLGPQGRIFGISMFHQLHCLNKVRVAILQEPPSPGEKWHVQHCLNYLRQMFLCAAGTRLEPVKDSVTSEHGMDKVDGLDLEHTCRDWSRLREEAKSNWREWSKKSEFQI